MAKAPTAPQAIVAEPRPIDSLKPYAKNAKKHPPAQVVAIAKSLREYGWVLPLLADKDMNVVGGHGRLLAAIHCRENGWAIPGWPDNSQVPVRSLDTLTARQVKAYRIADNRLAEMSSWDEDLLAQDLTELGGDIDLSGFGADDLAGLLAGPVKKAKRSPQDGAKVISYSLIFQTEEQHAAWVDFIKKARGMYPNEETVAGRVIAYLKEHGPGNG